MDKRKRQGMNAYTWPSPPASTAAATALVPGQRLTIVKRNEAGQDVATYPGTVVKSTAPAPWIEIEAIWTIPYLEPEGGLAFRPGDIMREFFSPQHPYNAFAVYAPDGEIKGWYGNVTYPAVLEDEESEAPRLVWQDLYLDVVLLLNGAMSLLDEDELVESGLPRTNPALAAAIIAARAELILALQSFPTGLA